MKKILTGAALLLSVCLAAATNTYNILDKQTAAIVGGTIDGTTIGQTTPAAGAFTTLTATTPVGVASGGTGAATITGLVLGNGAAAMTAYAGSSCTNQFARSTDASGNITCATVGSADLASSLSLVTPSLGVATATSINGNIFTTGSSTYTGTAGRTYTFPTTSATIARTDAANTFTGHQTIEGVTSTGATGTGAFVFATSPTLVTPVLGAATGTSLDGAIIGGTTPAAITGTTINGTVITATTDFLAPAGSIGTPSFGITGETNTGMYKSGTGILAFTLSGAQRYTFAAGTMTIVGGAPAISLGTNTTLVSDAANNMAFRSGTSAQMFKLYNTYTDASNYERLGVNWTSNLATINPEALGTGTQRNLGLATAAGRVLVGGTTDDGSTLFQVNGGEKVVGTLNATVAVQVNGTALLPVLTGTTGSIGGAVTVGTCDSGTVAVTSSTTSMTVQVSPNTYPGDGYTWYGYVSTNGTVTVKVCGLIAGTPTSSTYNVRVTQ